MKKNKKKIILCIIIIIVIILFICFLYIKNQIISPTKENNSDQVKYKYYYPNISNGYDGSNTWNSSYELDYIKCNGVKLKSDEYTYDEYTGEFSVANITESVLCNIYMGVKKPDPPTISNFTNTYYSISYDVTEGTDTEFGIREHSCMAKATNQNTIINGTYDDTNDICTVSDLDYGTQYEVRACATNNLGGTACSEWSEWYTWYGLPSNTYVAGSTIEYAYKSWSVVEDAGDYTKLALNGVAAHGNGILIAGTYTNSTTELSSWLDNDASYITSIDKNYSGLELQDGNYATTDSNYTANSPAYSYWIGSGSIRNQAAFYRYTRNIYRSMTGYSYDDDTKTTPIFIIYPTYSSTLSVASGAVIPACSSGCTYTYTNDSSAITYVYSGVSAYANPYQYYSSARIAFKPTNYTSTTLTLFRSWYSWNTTTGAQQEDGSGTFTNTKKCNIYKCGGSDHGGLKTLSTSDQVGHWYRFAATGDSTVSGSSPSYTRKYRLDLGTNCYYKPTSYNLTNSTASIYYRPYVWVKERT